MSHPVRIGDATLYLGDCRAILPTLDRASIDAVVSDPPYGIAYRHHGGVRGVKAAVDNTQAASRRGNPAIAGDDAPFDPAPLCGFPRVLLWGADHYRKRLPDGGRFIAWDKSGGGRGPADTFCDAEFAWTNQPVKRNVFRWLLKGLACDRSPHDDNATRHHPMQKPIELCKWSIRTTNTPDGGTVLDPYMGVGSFGVAALLLGHRFIGIEIERRWFDIACRRIQKAHDSHALLHPL